MWLAPIAARNEERQRFSQGRVANVLFWLKVFRYSFSEAIPIFFNRFKGDCYPCLIAIKFSPMIDYRLKFVKMQVLVKSILL